MVSPNVDVEVLYLPVLDLALERLQALLERLDREHVAGAGQAQYHFAVAAPRLEPEGVEDYVL